MKKQFIIALLYLNFLYADDFLYTLPDITIDLKAGEQRIDTAFSRPSPQGWEMTTFNFESNSNLTLNGAAGSKYTLKVDDDTTTFYANSFTIGANSNLELNNFHTISFKYGVNLGENANLTIVNSGKRINYMGSEYGGYSKIRFEKNSQFILGANSTAKITRATIFSSDGEVELRANSTLDISVTNAVRFENKFVNNGGTAIFRNDYQSTLGRNNGVYNIGQSLDINTNTISNFINNSGTVTVYGDFYNGGQAVTDSPFDPPFGGGGNLIINGGSVEVKGTLISQMGGDEVWGGYIQNAQNSTIQLYGGTLIVGGGLQNGQGSTLIFGIGSGGKMGELHGNLINDKGVVAVDIKDATLGTSYKIINGAVNGLGSNDIQIINANSQFFNTSFNASNGTLIITQATNANGETKFDEYKKGLSSNLRGILNAMSFKFGGDEALLTSDINLQTAISTTDTLIKESFVSNPQTMMNVLQSSALPFDEPKSTFVARRTAASEIIRFDNGKRVSAFRKKPAPPQRNFYFNPLGAVLRADKLTGYIAGFTLGASYESKVYANQIYLAYAYGASSQDFDTQSADTTGNLFQAGFLNRYTYNVFEMTMNANALLGFFKIKNEWQDHAILDSTANFGNYQFNLGFTAGIKLGDKLSFKPFVGVQNYIQMQEGFKSNGGLELESKAYNAYIIDGVLGIQTRYIYDEFISMFAHFSFENKLYNTPQQVLMRTFGHELKYENQSYDNVLSLNLGTQLLTYYNIKLDAELLYKHYNSGLNYYGGNLSLKYLF